MRKGIIWMVGLLTCWAVRLSGQPQCVVTHYDEFSGMAQWYVTQIVQDRQGMIWFATWNGLDRYDGYEFQNFKSRVGDGIDIPSDRMRDMVLDEEGNLLCRFDDHVFLFNVKTCNYSRISKDKEARLIGLFDHRHQQDLHDSAKPLTFTDRYGVIWMLRRDGTIYYKEREDSDWIPYPAHINVREYLFYCMTDREGNVWLKSDFGAYKLTFRQRNYQMFEQQKPDQVRCFCLDARQRYWVTTRNEKTVVLYDKENRRLGYLGRDGRLHAGYTSFGSPIYHVMQDSKGVFWLCSKPDGLFRLEETSDGQFCIDQFRHQANDPASLSNDELYYSVEDQLGRIWIATFNQGINCIEQPYGRQLRFLNKSSGLQYPQEGGMRTRQIHVTEKGVLLAATTSGLLVADVTQKNPRDIRFRLHTRDINRSSSLSNNAVMYVMEDSQHRIFVCTESGGLNQVLTKDLLADQLEFKHYNTETGFPSDVTLSAVSDKDCLLVVCNNEIIWLDPADGRNTSFDTHFWQGKFRFSDAVPMLLPDGRQIFGLQEGAFTVRPELIHKSDFVPPVVLSSISVQNRQPDYAVSALEKLELSPSERNVTISFAALDYSDDGNISYAYRLGDDSQPWNYIGKNRHVTFLDMRPGKHTLTIRSTNSDGIWVDNEKKLTIIVRPTFWETPWASLLWILLTGLIVWGLLYTRRYILRLKHQQHELHEAYLALLNAREAGQPGCAKPDDRPDRPKMKPEDEAFMQRAMKFIEEHLSDADINIGDMADATATSRSGLNRKMKSLLGVTPLDFIREARIRKACQMLRDGAMVNDVASSCGFSNPKYFGKCFKAEMGMTPTEYKVENSAN